MKNLFGKTVATGAAALISVKTKTARVKAVLTENKAEGFVDTAGASVRA
jgi:hypothetical protein